MDNFLTPEKQEAMIEDALHTHPVADLPRDMTTNVMRRIRTVPAPRPFRFTSTDLILGSVLVICIAAIWFSLQNLPPLIVAQIRKESILLYQQVIINARWLIPVLSFTLAAFFAALTIPMLRRELMK